MAEQRGWTCFSSSLFTHLLETLGSQAEKTQISVACSISAFKCLLFASPTMAGLRKQGLYLNSEIGEPLCFSSSFNRTCLLCHKVGFQWGFLSWDHPQNVGCHGPWCQGAEEGQQGALGRGLTLEPPPSRGRWWPSASPSSGPNHLSCWWSFCTLFLLPAPAHIYPQVAEAQCINLFLLSQNFHWFHHGFAREKVNMEQGVWGFELWELERPGLK